MTWHETLVELRDELAEARTGRKQQASAYAAAVEEVRGEMSRLADSLGIISLLSEINATLLDDQGAVETIVSWESGESGDATADDEDEDDAEDQDAEDAITTVLAWEEDGEREIAVEVVATEDGISLQVNGVEIRGERDALEQGLVEAFRDELEV